ncbi:hypothetical protein BC936DRAFT_143212 [Jimgerdemannia flammicorona]|uniref:Uncharacterized protein n=1 Tax=Jimgerdemannia flammicorona TaxID=994334 RepID=A0A432ZZP9_9FUNG|nr:hypothetical protein BC936DRAFT_143212 [Jimgerdemannia flammicorona]
MNLGVEWFGLHAGRWVAVEELALGVNSSVIDLHPHSILPPLLLTRIRNQQFFPSRHAITAFFLRPSPDLKPINSPQHLLGYPLGDKCGGSRKFSQLIDGEDTVADHVGLRGGEGGEDQARAIAEDEGGSEVDCLEVLGLAWGGGDRDALFANQGVDRRRFANVRVAYQADHELVIVGVLGVFGICWLRKEIINKVGEEFSQ